MLEVFHLLASVVVSVVGRELGEDAEPEPEVTDTPTDDPSLELDSKLTGEFERVERALDLSSVSSAPADARLEYADSCSFGLGGDLITFARARFTTDTCRTIVAGVTVIVDMLESRFSLSRVKSTCSSLLSDRASSEVAGEVPAMDEDGVKIALGAGEEGPESGDLTIL